MSHEGYKNILRELYIDCKGTGIDLEDILNLVIEEVDEEDDEFFEELLNEDNE